MQNCNDNSKSYSSVENQEEEDSGESAQYFLFGQNGVQTYISNQQVKHLKKLNPCLQFADEEGGAVDPSKLSARNKTTTGALRDDLIHQSTTSRN